MLKFNELILIEIYANPNICFLFFLSNLIQKQTTSVMSIPIVCLQTIIVYAYDIAKNKTHLIIFKLLSN